MKLSETEIKSFIGQMVELKFDQPAGSSYSGHDWTITYPINYGYVPGTVSGDGEELDAYLLGVTTPQDKFKGRCIAIIHRTNDDDDKLIVVPDGQNFSDRQIREMTYFQEQFFESIIWR